MAEAILRLPQVRSRVGLSRTTIYDQIARGLFPRQIKLGERASGWLASEIDAWLNARVTESRGCMIASPNDVAGDAER